MQSAYAGPGAGAPAGPPLGAGTGTDATQPKQQSVPAGGQAHFRLVSHCAVALICVGQSKQQPLSAGGQAHLTSALHEGGEGEGRSAGVADGGDTRLGEGEGEK